MEPILLATYSLTGEVIQHPMPLLRHELDYNHFTASSAFDSPFYATLLQHLNEAMPAHMGSNFNPPGLWGLTPSLPPIQHDEDFLFLQPSSA